MHDLVKLLSVCVAIDPMLADIEIECVTLSAYGVFPQYPDEWTTWTEAMLGRS